MTAEDAGRSQQWGSAFQHASTDGMSAYNEALVPPMFIPWAEYLLDSLSITAGEHVLDIATGPGTVARLAAARVGPTGRVLGTDLSPAMLSIAESKGAVDGGCSIEFRLSAASPLDAPDAAFDVVCCQQGLQFFPDRPSALLEMRRALRVGGRLGLAVWCGIEDCPPFAAVRDAIGDLLGEDAAGRYAQGPWGFHAPEALATLVRSAGFGDVNVEEAVLPVKFASARPLDRSLAASGLATEIGALPEEERAALAEAIATRLEGITNEDGEVVSQLASQVVVAVVQ